MVLQHFLSVRESYSKYSPGFLESIGDNQKQGCLPLTLPVFLHCSSSVWIQRSSSAPHTPYDFFFLSPPIELLQHLLVVFVVGYRLRTVVWPCWRGDKQRRFRQERSPLPKDLSCKESAFFIFAAAQDPPVLSTHKPINILYGCSSYFDFFFLPLQLHE